MFSGIISLLSAAKGSLALDRMSALTRFLRPIPAARRPYSSFFSKPGGGRYFNSHKPAKPVVAVNNTNEPAGSPPDASDSSPTSSASGNIPNPSSPLLNPDDAPSSPSVAPPPRLATLVPLAASAVRHPEGLPSHPIIEPEEFQLHQFFSIHRPLLLLSNPPSILHSPPPAAPLFPTQSYKWTSLLPDDIVGNQQETKFPVDPDAEAARQLTRALTMTRAGATVSWENTLRRLGMDVDLAAKDLRATEWDQEWEDILADSVKRKRRKKMKKHK
ncbi:hypothetical protein B0H19DRAFT_586947 [Mycena capillaripes]|nr:hypothetical protein B0H19DRAFT_586947 [Mycena capillaripes]